MICPHCRHCIIQDSNPPAACPNCGLSFIELAARHRRELIGLWTWYNSLREAFVSRSNLMHNLKAALRGGFTEQLVEPLDRIAADLECITWFEPDREEATV